METTVLFIGIGIIIIGWLSLSYFAFKQIRAQKEYERLPQKWAEIKHSFVIKRWICRGIIIFGLVVGVISLCL